MDRSLYVAMTGAAQILRAQAENNHNLANASTTGFKAEIAALQSVPVQGNGYASRLNAVAQVDGWDFSPGVPTTTGRELDLAVQGNGWIAVQSPDGSEGYTRAGDLRLDADGLLTTARGYPVLGDGGTISVPPNAKLEIGTDGTVSVIPLGQGSKTVSAVGRIKLVAPDQKQLQLGSDGLMHLRGGGSADADASVHVMPGTLESSNVNPAEALARMIDLSRQFEMQIKSIHTTDENAQAANKLLEAT